MKQRLFLAIPLPAALKEQIADALQAYKSTLDATQAQAIRFIPAENWHVTIYFFGDVALDKTDMLWQQLQPILSSTPLFVLRPDRLLVAPPEKREKSMIWLRWEEHATLTDLSWQIYQATQADFVFEKPRPTLVPHVTAARFKSYQTGRLPEITGDFAFDELPVPGCELWESVLGPAGAVYAKVQSLDFRP